MIFGKFAKAVKDRIVASKNNIRSNGHLCEKKEHQSKPHNLFKKKISKWNMYLPIKNKTKNFWKKIFVTLARSPTLCLGESGLSASVSR